jgi:hypothetical protein
MSVDDTELDEIFTEFKSRLKGALNGKTKKSAKPEKGKEEPAKKEKDGKGRLDLMKLFVGKKKK